MPPFKAFRSASCCAFSFDCCELFHSGVDINLALLQRLFDGLELHLMLCSGCRASSDWLLCPLFLLKGPESSCVKAAICFWLCACSSTFELRSAWHCSNALLTAWSSVSCCALAVAVSLWTASAARTFSRDIPASSSVNASISSDSLRAAPSLP